MFKKTVVLAAMFAAVIPQTAAAQRLGSDSERASFQMSGPTLDSKHVIPPFAELGTSRSTIGATVLGSAVGAAATLAYFAVRDEDNYECNACAEMAIVAGLTTMAGSGMGARAAGASIPRSIVASLAGTVVGILLGVAMIEPLGAGWAAGMVSYTVGQGLTAGMIAQGGVR
jgi:hypothetical protein